MVEELDTQVLEFRWAGISGRGAREEGTGGSSRVQKGY